ncbi:MAG: LysR family transcriptional regulator [Anaerolineae bacterium]|jgi:DNA-binding transcriptional LysR family regulator|nr:LysR family transcriptional regulator [Anaerolineae bacterium]MDX9829601.1 LysR family transcriptional regulator [Anaerolineae bacterium]
MNLDHLRTLVSVVEQGSLSAAARIRRISQPAVTKQLQRMEADLGLALLIRGPRRQIELTPAGERVVAFARRILGEYDALERDLAAMKAVGSGTLSLAASTIPGEYLLPRLLAAFRREYPEVSVEMTISDTTTVVERLLASEADIGIVGSDLRRPGLRLERLLDDEVVLVVPPDHPFAGRKEVEVKDLSDQSLVLREEGSGTRRSVEVALERAGQPLSLQSRALILGSTQAVLQAVAEGLGIGFVSARAAAQSVRDGRLASLGLKGIDLRRSLYLAYLPQRAGDPLVTHFLAFARAHAGNEVSLPASGAVET